MNFKKLKSQSGRSMVEMLGVLAIIGVLSVGGIAGYSLSMRRHRANGIVDTVTKYALSAYSVCQQRVLNGEASDVSACHYCISESGDGEIYLPFSAAGLGAMPAGVTGFGSWRIRSNATTGVDTVHMPVWFSDTKLCQTVASIVGTSCDAESQVEFKINQN